MTWKRLAEFWKHSDCNVRLKLGVYDAVIRSKLIYGLESVQINDSLKRKLDAFQLKGIRQILQLKTTYVDRANSNEVVFRKANEAVKTYEVRRTHIEDKFRSKKCIIPMSEYYEVHDENL